jgi:hypothetical protein
VQAATRRSVQAGLATALLGAAAFVVVHVLVLTPYKVLHAGDPAWKAALSLLGAGVVALPLALACGPAAGLAWQAIRVERGRLAGWRFGLLFAAFPLPALLASLAAGPFGEDPGPWTVAAMLAHPAAAAAIGGWLGGWRGALGLALSIGLVAAVMAPFTLSVPVAGLPGLFVLGAMAVFAACGPAMERIAGGRGAPA